MSYSLAAAKELVYRDNELNNRQCLCFSPHPSDVFVICYFGELNGHPKFQRFHPLYDSDAICIF